MKSLPTVDIVDPKGSDEKRTINEADFDPHKHVRWEDKKPRQRTRKRRDDDD